MMETAATDAERDKLSDLMGKSAIANARIAYDKFKEIFSGDRWEALAAKGARVQRCLWASTSTKNPQYRDVLYVEELIGSDTVNTLPQNTLDAFRDHGQVALTLENGVDEANAHIKRLAEVGIDIDAVTEELQVQGVDLFIKSYRGAMDTVRDKRERMQKGEIGATARRE
jgi:transaldolase